jgi:hypothetical protein
MVKFGLLVPLKDGQGLSKDTREWLVPSLLSDAQPVSVDWEEYCEFFLWFSTSERYLQHNLSNQEMTDQKHRGFLPCGVVPHVLGAIVQVGGGTRQAMEGRGEG